MQNIIAKAEIIINAPVEKVWNALIDPAIIKQYLFGTNAKSDWKVGSKITYSGEWQGIPYEDRGVILEMEINKLLVTSYWSASFGDEDKPENHKKVSYILEEIGNITKITIIQDNNKDEESKNHSEQNWNMVLKTMKDILEK